MGAGTWMDVWMNERTACGFDMAGNSIVFDIAEEILPPPRWWDSLLGLFLSILWDKIKHTSIPLPTHQFPLSPALPSDAVTSPGDTLRDGVLRPSLPGGQSYDRSCYLAAKTPPSLRGARGVRCMQRTDETCTPSIGSLPSCLTEKRGGGSGPRGTRPTAGAG